MLVALGLLKWKQCYNAERFMRCLFCTDQNENAFKILIWMLQYWKWLGWHGYRLNLPKQQTIVFHGHDVTWEEYFIRTAASSSPKIECPRITTKWQCIKYRSFLSICRAVGRLVVNPTSCFYYCMNTVGYETSSLCTYCMIGCSHRQYWTAFG